MRIGIIGEGILMEKENLELSIEDTVFFTVKKTLDSTGLNRDEIDTVIQAGDDVLDGVAINHVYNVEASGSFLKEESKVERDGAWAVHYAIARLLSGKFETAMVVAYSKGSQLGMSAFSGMSADPFYLRPVGADMQTICALQANYFSGRTGLNEKDFATVAAKNRKAGMLNSRTMQGQSGDFSIEEILASRPLATPINEKTASQEGDGCTVLILATEDYVKRSGRQASWITGVGFTSDAYYPTYREFGDLKGAEIAAKTAWKMAGLKSGAVDFAEVHELYAHQELMLYEPLGLCEAGKTADMIREGKTTREGNLPVNPSGGVLCGNVSYASGLSRMLEASLQLKGNAGESQLKGGARPTRALVHAQAGLAMQSNIVYVLEA